MTNGIGTGRRQTAGLFEFGDESVDTLFFERLLGTRGFCCIAGTDEVGRGPLAGPVIAAAVVLPSQCDAHLFRDSKRTTRNERYRLRDHLLACNTAIGIGCVDAQTIDRINILQASLLAMARSIAELERQGASPDFILVDGNRPLPLATPQEALVKGDSRSASIAAASIVAKLHRDELMAELHAQYPMYGFLANKGYPTSDHRRAVQHYGPSPAHRLSFRGVREHVGQRG